MFLLLTLSSLHLTSMREVLDYFVHSSICASYDTLKFQSIILCLFTYIYIIEIYLYYDSFKEGIIYINGKWVRLKKYFKFKLPHWYILQ